MNYDFNNVTDNDNVNDTESSGLWYSWCSSSRIAMIQCIESIFWCSYLLWCELWIAMTHREIRAPTVSVVLQSICSSIMPASIHSNAKTQLGKLEQTEDNLHRSWFLRLSICLFVIGLYIFCYMPFWYYYTTFLFTFLNSLKIKILMMIAMTMIIIMTITMMMIIRNK